MRDTATVSPFDTEL